MTPQSQALREFAQFNAGLIGNEKSEAQTYLLNLFAAFGHAPGKLPAGAIFEHRVRFAGSRTKFADLFWPGRCLVEMKSRGEKLSKHYQQTFDYWLNLVPHRPPYVVLCNFDELWIYDFNVQLHEPLDRLLVSELDNRQTALAFLWPKPGKPQFKNNVVAVTREAAADVAEVYMSLVKRDEDAAAARRFVLQCVVAMFSEDIGLLPPGLFTLLLEKCRAGESSVDLIGGLFRQMNDLAPAKGGLFKNVSYFNGGLFTTVTPIELTAAEIQLLFDAADKHHWSSVQPVIFGTLFEGSLKTDERHALGAHFTSEADIQKIVRPTIVRPWDERINSAKNAAELIQLLKELRNLRILDPACGSGNFLFVSYRAIRELEQRLLLRLFSQNKRYFARLGLTSGITPTNFFGIDTNENAVEVAKVTLMLARRLAHHQSEELWDAHKDELPGLDSHSLQFEQDLPLDNLDKNIVCADAIFSKWPAADIIIGNPPYQSKEARTNNLSNLCTR